MKLEFTTTAMRRPSLLETTYQSFTKKLRGVNFKESVLYINIDPAPDTSTQQAVINVAKKYFGDVVANIPTVCNFCAAVKWCFSKPSGKYFFHLEDDWVLLKEIHIDDLIGTLDNKNGEVKDDSRFVSITLRGYPVVSQRIVLAPSLFYSGFANDISGKMDVRYNPEEQLRERPSKNGVRKTRLNDFALRFPESPKEVIIRDIGREWLKANGIVGNKMKQFIRWKRW